MSRKPSHMGPEALGEFTDGELHVDDLLSIQTDDDGKFVPRWVPGERLDPIRNAGGDGGGSSSAVQTREYVSGNPVTIANQATAPLTWDSAFTDMVNGAVLLDLSDPEKPTVVEAGVYAVSINVAPTGPLGDGGYFSLAFDLDVDGDDLAFAAETSELGCASSLTAYIPAGGTITALVTNSGNEAGFAVSSAYVQRLS